MSTMNTEEDFSLAMAIELQEQLDMEDKASLLTTPPKLGNKNCHSTKPNSIVDASWEYIDPTPDIHVMFVQFNKRFFWGKLDAVEVKWSSRMTLCAGVCQYKRFGGMCVIRLSLPLLKLRPRKDLVETMLHEMIHAYLFVTNNNDDRDGHGPEFHSHMYRINKEAGTSITVYHNFHDEVKLYKQHWWRCDGPCQKWPPFFGMVKRSINRAPGSSDFWWDKHQSTCDGKFIKIREPEGFGLKKKEKLKVCKGSPSKDIRTFFPVKAVHNGAISELNSKDKISSKDTPSSQKLNLPKEAKVCEKSVAKDRRNQHVTKPMKDVRNSLVSNTDAAIKQKTNSIKPGQNVKSIADIDKHKGKTSGAVLNKGIGILVLTNKKGRRKTEINDVQSEGESSNDVHNNFVPFSGNGYTLGTSGVLGEKPWMARLDKIASQTKKTSSLSKKPYKRNAIDTVENSTKKLKANNTSNQGNIFIKIPDIPNTASTQSSVEIPNKEDMVACPCCNVCVRESYLNTHLDSCLESVFSSDFEDESSSHSMGVKCPICNKDVEEKDINSHIDLCQLSINDEDVHSTPSQEEKDEKADTNRLIKCPMCNNDLKKSDLGGHLESCVGSALNNDVIVIEDDSDDETNEENKELSYPCPCCANMVRDSLMNIHLDECLSAVIVDTSFQSTYGSDHKTNAFK